MFKLMIECSRTGQIIFTGIETDRSTFAKLHNFVAQTHCPYCTKFHRWSKDDVCLELNNPSCDPLH